MPLLSQSGKIISSQFALPLLLHMIDNFQVMWWQIGKEFSQSITPTEILRLERSICRATPRAEKTEDRDSIFVSLVSEVAPRDWPAAQNRYVAYFSFAECMSGVLGVFSVKEQQPGVGGF